MLQLKAILIIRSQRKEKQGAHKFISMRFQDFHIDIYIYTWIPNGFHVRSMGDPKP